MKCPNCQIDFEEKWYDIANKLFCKICNLYCWDDQIDVYCLDIDEYGIEYYLSSNECFLFKNNKLINVIYYLPSYNLSKEQIEKLLLLA